MAIRKQLTPEIFVNLYVKKQMSLTKIGNMFGVSRQRVHQLKKEYEKKHGKMEKEITIDVITLKHYLDQGWTAKQIAERFELKPSKVTRLIRNYREKFNKGYVKLVLKRKTAEDLISKNELESLYVKELLTDEEIGKKYQLSPSTIGMLRKRYNIQTIRTKALRKLPLKLTKEKFERLYLKEKMTLQEIADKMDCNIVSVIELKREYRITK